MFVTNQAGRDMLFSDHPLPPPRRNIGEYAESRLRSNSYLALKNVSCEYQDGVLILRGYLPTYYLKQMAQETIARIEGVQRVANEIEVSSSARHPIFPT